MKDYFCNNFATGRISEIIQLTKNYFNTESLDDVSTEDKINILCYALEITKDQLDLLISTTPQTLRTIKGHAFESVFDELMEANGVMVKTVGGDCEIDRIVNNVTLQLKTPTIQGSNDREISYKTHKTHGPKSEEESLDYYCKASEFAEYLLGLISYNPFKVAFIVREALPRLASDTQYIQSPFKYDLAYNSEHINKFECINVDDFEVPSDFFNFDISKELLPLTSKVLGLKTDIIINTIYSESNFRIWDMNMRGFARELALINFLEENNISAYNPAVAGKPRANKSDLALKSHSEYYRIQVKGITLGGSKFIGKNSRVDIESQLSRGRCNDHPTQSRLYHYTDFEFLILCIDPFYSKHFHVEVGLEAKYQWEFYCIPQPELKRHKTYTERINSHQKLKYTDLQKYRVNQSWLNHWV